MRANADHRVVADFALEFLVGATRARDRQRHADLGYQLLGLQHCRQDRDVQVANLDDPLAVWPAGDHFSLGGQQRGWPIGGRVRVGDGPGHRSTIADERIADATRGIP